MFERNASVTALDTAFEAALVCAEECFADLEEMYRDNFELFERHDTIIAKLAQSKRDLLELEESIAMHELMPIGDHQMRNRTASSKDAAEILDDVLRPKPDPEPEEAPVEDDEVPEVDPVDEEVPDLELDLDLDDEPVEEDPIDDEPVEDPIEEEPIEDEGGQDDEPKND